MKAALDRLRGARGLELFALMAVVAAILAIALGTGTGQKTGASEQTPLELRLEGVLEKIDGAGDVSVMITQREDGEIVGAAVVTSGIGGVSAYLDMQSAVKTLLNIDTSRIQIIGDIQ